MKIHYILTLSLIPIITGCYQPIKPEISDKIRPAPIGFYTYKGEVPDYGNLLNTYSVKTLEDVHFELRRKFTVKADDKEHWGSGMVGDCDDFAIAVHLELARKGINSNLAFVHYLNPNGKREGHLITYVDQYVFDVRYNHLTLFETVEYELQSTGNLSSNYWKEFSNNTL